jgi:uncharacterized membrane protein
LRNMLPAAHEWTSKNLHILFAVLVAPLVFCFSLVAPPLQAPDEWAHFARSAEIAGGEMIGSRPTAPNSGSAGAHIPESTVAFINYFQGRLQNIPALACDSKSEIIPLSWNSPETFYQFRLIVYPPFSYMPSALGLLAGRILGSSLLTSYYLGRFCAAIAFVLLSMFAIRRASAGKLLVFALLSMPLTIYLASSFSHDGMLIACGALIVAGLGDWVNSSVGQGDGGGANLCGRWLLAISLSALTLIVTERPTYAPLVVAGAAVALAVIPDRKTALKTAGLAVAIPWVVAVLWMVVTHKFVHIGDGVDAGANAKFMFRHLDQMPSIFWTAITTNDPVTTKGFIGILGSLSIWLPKYCYVLYSFVLISTLLYDGLFSRNGLLLSRRAIVAAGIVGTVMSIYLWAYLCLTPMGNPVISAPQGRYFIIPVMFLGLVVGRRMLATSSKLQECAALGLLVAVIGGIWVADVGALLTMVEFYHFQ